MSPNFSRRGFLQGALASGVFVLRRALHSRAAMGRGRRSARAPFEPSLWMSIAPDGTVTIVAHRSEMGCGSRTALPLVVADELDADWSRVKHRAGDWRSEIRRSGYGRLALGPQQFRPDAPGGRYRTRNANQRRRRAVECSRQKTALPSPTSSCIQSSGRKLGYGEVAAAAAKLPVPKKERRAAQATLRMALHRQREQFTFRPARDRHRQGNLRHGRHHARHGLRVGRASARARAKDQIVR